MIIAYLKIWLLTLGGLVLWICSWIRRWRFERQQSKRDAKQLEV